MKTTVTKLIALLAASLLLTACAPAEPTETTTEPTTQATTQATTAPTTEATTAPTEPQAPKMNATGIFQELLQAGNCFTMELCQADGTVYGPLQFYTVPTNLKLLNPGGITETEAPDESSYQQWLRFRSADGSVSLTVYHGTPDIFCYEENGEITYYQAAEEAFDFLRSTFDPMEKAIRGRIAFSSDSTGEALLKAYAETAFPDFLAQLAPGSMYRYTDYAVLSATVEEESDTALVGTFTYVAKPERFSMILTDDMLVQDGDYKGWYQFEVPVALELRQDGLWHEITSNEYHSVYTNDIPAPPAATPDADAAAYLAALPETLSALQTSSEKEDLEALAQAFLDTLRAVAKTGAADFDWTVLLTPTALEKAEIKVIINGANANPASVRQQFQGQMLWTDDSTACLYHYEMQVFFLQQDGKWFIDAIIMPFLLG